MARFLLVNPWRGIIGPNVGMGQMVRALCERGHQVHVVTLELDELARQWQQDGAICHINGDLDLTQRAFSPWQLLGHLAKAWRTAAYVGKLAGEVRADLIVVNSENMLLMPRAGAVAGCPTAIMIRGHRFEQLGRLGRVFFGLQQHWTQRYIAVSHATGAAMRRMGVPGRKVLTVCNGVDTVHYSPRSVNDRLVAELGIRPGSLIVGSIGHLEPRKGMHYFVDAFIRMAPRVPSAVCLVVGGCDNFPDAFYVREMRSRVEQAGLADRVYFLGCRRDVPDLINLMDVVVHPSESESFGRTIAEAMSSSKPVIGFNVEAINELVLDGRTGLLVQPFDTAAMADALVQLLNSPTDRQRMGRAGRQRAIECYDLARNIHQLADDLEKVAGARPAAAPAIRLGRMLGINQVTTNLFGDLVDSFVDKLAQVRLVAGQMKPNPGRDRFLWIRAAEFIRSPMWKRLLTWGRFTLGALAAMIRYRDHLAFITTNPPFVPWLAPLVKRLFGIRYAILVYDVYPDVMVRMNMIRAGGSIDRLLRRISAASLLNAECVITIGTRMRQTVLGHLPPRRSCTVEVIPNWTDTDLIKPVPRQTNPFAAEHGLINKFVVMYSGAFGATHDIESIVDAAELCRNLPDVCFVLIGDGTRLKEVQQYVAAKALANLKLLPWQKAEMLRYTVTSADALIVSLDAGYEGISVPSKTYTCLSAGAAILAISPPDTELTELIAQWQCGLWIRPRSSTELASAIHQIYNDRATLQRMQANARRVAIEQFSLDVCTRKYHKVLLPVLAGTRRPSNGKSA